MSLLLNASPWDSTPKKRIPTIKKQFKQSSQEKEEEEEPTNTPPIQGFDIFSQPSSSSVINPPPTREPLQYTINEEKRDNNSFQDNKTNKINQLLENMSGLNIQSDGDLLYNYNSPTTAVPTPSFPSIPIFQRETEKGEIIGQGTVENTTRGRGGGVSSNYIYNTSGNLANLENYSKAYEIPKETRPYYTQKMGIGNETDSFEEKILDKIQYLTHLMEEIQSEKTANITEEFILYTMLGVFVIYVVDAFSKSGKYIR